MTGPQARPFAGQDDFDKMIAFFQAIQAAENGLGVVEEDLTVEWIDDEPGWVRTLRVWEADGAIVASFGVWHEVEDPENRAYGMLDVHPDVRATGLADEVARDLIEACAELTGKTVTLRVTATIGNPTRRHALEHSGFTGERVYHRMKTTLYEPEPLAPLPEGLTIRPQAGEAEAGAWAATYSNAFAEAYDAHGQTEDDKLHRMGLKSYRPDLDLVLVDANNEMIGIAFCVLEPVTGGGDQAWVNQLGVLKEWRGKGLGRALLTAGMDAFHKRGVRDIWLTVDSENETGALGLYESAGFEPFYQAVVYKRDITPV